ncbi:MAG: GNAT family N-acetyltransferase [Bacteriovoracaceae bacterium]|jgi:[ribosomal protein S5]-alanine N-acetyltransferase|nr:GNAT family N-acetyltransferase [Bacteriovoracaceae bacterium]
MSNKKTILLEYKTRRLHIRVSNRGDYRTWKQCYLEALPSQNEFDDDLVAKKDLNYKTFLGTLAHEKTLRERGQIYFMSAFERKSGKMIARVGFTLIQRYNVQRAYLSYVVINNYWRKGFGRELVKKSAEFAIKSLKIHRLEAEIQPHNKASIKLIKSLGFRYEGLKKWAVFFEGKWHDHRVYALTAEDIGISRRKPNRSLEICV